MKRLLILIPAILALFVFTNQSIAQNVPKKVKEAFNKKFPDAQKVNWGKENATEYEAEFTLDGKEASANFDEKGEWIETEMPVAENELPDPVRKTLSRDYKEAKLLRAFEITYPGEPKTMYEVELKMEGEHEMTEEEEEEHEQDEQNEENEEEEEMENEKNVRELLFTKDGKVVNKNIMEEEDEY